MEPESPVNEAPLSRLMQELARPASAFPSLLERPDKELLALLAWLRQVDEQRVGRFRAALRPWRRGA